MKNLVLGVLTSMCVGLIGAPLDAVGQDGVEGNEEVSIDDFKVPATPALNILGITPTAIDRPSTPRAFGAALLKATNEADGAIPKNLAIEISPYWMQSREITFDEYYGLDDGDNGYKWFDGLLQSLTFSLGSAEFEREVGAMKFEGTSVAVGVSFDILRGKPATGIGDKKAELTRLVREAAAAGLELISDERFIEELWAGSGEEPAVDVTRLEDGDNAEWKKAEGLIAIAISEREQVVSSTTATVKEKEIANRELGVLRTFSKERLIEKGNKANEANKKLADFLVSNKERVGFQLQVASAIAYDAFDDETSDFEYSRSAAWLTLSYRHPNGAANGSQFTWLATGRYMNDDSYGESTDNFDLGGRVIWKNPLTDKDGIRKENALPISLSAEYLYRFSDLEDTQRAVATLEYALNEDVSFYVSYGKNFENDVDGNDLVAIAGVNIGFGGKPKAKLGQ